MSTISTPVLQLPYPWNSFLKYAEADGSPQEFQNQCSPPWFPTISVMVPGNVHYRTNLRVQFFHLSLKYICHGHVIHWVIFSFPDIYFGSLQLSLYSISERASLPLGLFHNYLLQAITRVLPKCVIIPFIPFVLLHTGQS